MTCHRDSLEPNCNQTLADTILDMQLLSQITTRLWLYTSACNETVLVLEAIKQSKVNLKVFPSISLVDEDEDSYQLHKTALKEALQTYGTSNVLGITVGHEVMFNYLLERNSEDPNNAFGLAASSILKGRFTDIRKMLISINVTLPIGTTDAAGYFNIDLLSASDFGCACTSPQRLTKLLILLLIFFQHGQRARFAHQYTHPGGRNVVIQLLQPERRGLGKPAA